MHFMWYRALLVAIVANAACAIPEEPTDTRSQSAVAGSTVVSLTFDDTFADNYQVGAMAEARGMRATFYVNSGRFGTSGYMTLDQLLALQARGHEIAGHTITHARLGAIAPEDARRQVCNDRAQMLDAGFRVTSFAYPFSSQNSTVHQIVADCGYNSARLVGGLVVPGSCNGCPYANPIPPPLPMQVRANDSVDNTTTLDRMKLYVTQAEQNGGGWVPMVFHHVCDGCDSLAVSPAVLAQFLDWLAARQAQGTVVATVDEVMGGSSSPRVVGPPAPPPSLLQNGSLETDANADQVPDCWQRGGTGTNSATYSLVSGAYDGSVAQRIDMTSFTSGARRLVTRQDTSSCSPAAIAGHRYTVTARYISNTQPIFSVYYRNSTGSWVWFAQSPSLPASSSYALASYTTPALPAGATAISFGLSIVAVGSLTTDYYSLYDATPETTAPSISITSPASGASVNGVVQIWTSASDPAGVTRVELLVNGSLVQTDPAEPFWFAWNSAAFAGQSVTLTARAVDGFGNSATTSRTVTVQSAPDTTPPTVAMQSPATGGTVSGTIQVTATASDASGIARVEFLRDGALIGTDTTAPYGISWDSSPYAGQTVALAARAIDNANNVATSTSNHVNVSAGGDTTLPVVVLTSPADGATVSGSITLSADATDEGGIARVEFFANGTLVATELTAPYELTWDTTPFAGQSVTLTARAFDNANNQTTSPPRQITVAGTTGDTTPPTVALTSPANGATVSGTVTLSASATDAGGIARVEFFANSTLIATETSAPYELPWDTAPFAGQTVTLTARAFDAANNQATSAPRTITVTGAGPVNLLQNASLETDANADQVPDCWQRGGSGTNAATYTLTTNAFSGSVAQRIDMTSYTSGARRIVSRQDTGQCAPAGTPGRTYTVTARYIANTAPVFTVYYRNSAGSWVFWAQSPSQPTSATYRLGTYTTPALPAGATAISVGLSIINLGSLTMDDFTLVAN